MSKKSKKKKQERITIEESARNLQKIIDKMRHYKPPETRGVKKDNITNEDRTKAIFDKNLKGDITLNELRHFLEFTRPKQLNPKYELTGYA